MDSRELLHKKGDWTSDGGLRESLGARFSCLKLKHINLRFRAQLFKADFCCLRYSFTSQNCVYLNIFQGKALLSVEKEFFIAKLKQ